MPTFTADVTTSGDVESGTARIEIVQKADAGPTPPDPEPQPPDPDTWEPPSWLRTDMEPVSASRASNPRYLEPTEDEEFHSKLTRVSGDPGDPIPNISGAAFGEVCRHHYSVDQVWNRDQSRIYLDTNAGIGAAGASELILDGETYEALFKPQNHPSSADVRWHNSDANLMNYVSGSELGTWNPETGSQMVIEDFGSKYSSMTFGQNEGSFSSDGRRVVITCQYEDQFTAFYYDVSTGEKGNNIWASQISKLKCDSARISTLGTFIIWGFDPDTVFITDLDGEIVTTLPEQYVSHFDVVTDDDGEECLCGRVNSGSIGQGGSGLISKYNLRTAKRTALTDGGWSYHTSCRSGSRWALSGAGNEGGNYPPYDGELLLAALDGSKVYRLCHSHVPHEFDYKAETQACLSPDGGRAFFAAAWGGTGSTPRPVGGYVVDFRA